ncbi:MAG: ATP-binding protein [Planctomycetota bacterium]
MPRLSILQKIFASYCLATLVGMVVTGWLLEEQLVGDLHDRLRMDLREQSAILAELARPYFRTGVLVTGDTWQDRLDRMGPDLPIRITLVAADGRVIADSDEQPAQMDNHAGRPELTASRETGVALAVRHSATLGQDLLYCARAIRDGEAHLGWVRVALALRFVQERRQDLRQSIMLGVVIAALAAAGLGFVFARRLTRPIVQLTDAATALAAGSQQVTLPPAGRDEIGALVRSFGSMASELERRFQTIARERNQLRAVLAGMHEGVVAVDAEERILHLNDAARDLLGISGEVSGRRLWEICTHERLSREMSNSMRQDESRDAEVTVTLGSGRRALIVRTAPLRSASQQAVGAVMVVADQTERRRLDDMRRDFVANVSHELKTPLTVIQGILETIESDAEMPEEMRTRFVGKAQAHARRLANLVTDLLVLSRLESQDQALDRERFDLRQSVRQALAGLQEAARAARITIALAPMPELLPADGDPEAIRQVVDNLLSNAIRYSPPHTTVRIAAGFEDERILYVSVQDEGIGIPVAAQQRIFERFYRVDKARSRELGGTGLGLAIVKHVVLAHRGSIEVDSEVGQGSTFIIRLPVRPTVARLPHEEAAAS